MAKIEDHKYSIQEAFRECFYIVPDYQRDYYLSILVNLPFVNGDASWRLPLPATYVVARDRRILFAEAHADFRVRPEPEEALAACRR